MNYDDWKATDPSPEPDDPRCPHRFMPDEHCPTCDEPAMWCCEGCGQWFDQAMPEGHDNGKMQACGPVTASK